MIVDALFLGPNNMRSEFAPSRVYQNPSVLHRFRVMGPLVVCLTVMKVKDRPNPIKLDVFRCVPSYQHLMGSWTSRTPANSYPRQDVPEIRDSRLVPSLLGCLPSRTRDGSYPRQVVP